MPRYKPIKYIKDVHVKHYKSLMKEIKHDLSKLRGISISRNLNNISRKLSR